MVTIRRSTPDGEEPGQQGSGVEKRLHPASARRSCAGNPCDGGAGAADAAACGDDDAAAAVGTIGSPVISHLSKGGRFAGEWISIRHALSSVLSYQGKRMKLLDRCLDKVTCTRYSTPAPALLCAVLHGSVYLADASLLVSNRFRE